MYIIGVDIGTTGTKSVVINQKGEKISTSYKGYDLIKNSNGYVEQSSDDWWNALIYTVKESTSIIENPNDIATISLSTQGGCLVCVDENGTPLCNAMVWMDTRSKVQYSNLLKLNSEDFYYNVTGWKLIAGLNLCKIKWLFEEKHDLFCKTNKFLSTIDYVNFKLTGKYVIDPSNAAMTQLYDIKNESWSKELLSILSIDETKLPIIKKSAEEVGTLTKEAAKALGLSQKVKVISGGHDQYCAALGCGVFSPGQMVISTGTAFAMLYVNDKPLFNTKTHIAAGPHLIDGLWGELATVPTAGVCMEWFKNNIVLESLEEIDEHAQNADCGNLYFYPYFTGSAFPDNNINAKACFMGLSLEHTKYDMAKSIMEGVAFQIRYALERFEKPSSIKIIGGACKSNLWVNILANILPYDLYKVSENNAAPLGAALVAGVGSGIFSNLKRYRSSEVIIPKNSEAVYYYTEKYKKYKSGIKCVNKFFAYD